MKKILITRVTGFIGYHLAEKLLNNNYGIVGIDNISNYYDEESIRLTTGAGVLWQSPFGPIRIDYSLPILKETYDKTETFSFNVGSLF